MKPSTCRSTITWLLAVLCTGCGTVPLTPWPEQTPLVQRIDARVGTSYAGAARLPIVTNPLIRIQVGQESVARFERVFASLFSRTQELPDWPPWREAGTSLDGVIELQRTEAELVLGNDAGGARAAPGVARPDVVHIAYRVCLFRPDGRELRCWNPKSTASHQRRAMECMDLRDCIVPQVEGAMRDAIARFMVDFEQDPVVRDWAAGLVR
jgi:hypothetical protein